MFCQHILIRSDMEINNYKIIGPEGTPYEKGVFKLDVHLPERYPFEPPKITFVTPIYHPNIDNAGRICLDSLKMPPKGAWKPALNICTVLTSIQLLMSEPNPEDPLMTDISNEFKYHRAEYNKHAREWTAKYAVDQMKETNPPAGKNKDKTAQAKDSSDESSDSEKEQCSKHLTNPKRPSGESLPVLKENVKRLKDS